jgi:hypothetical protein
VARFLQNYGRSSVAPSTADIDGNGTIGLSDLAFAQEIWGQTVPEGHPADLNGDLRIDRPDIVAVLQGFGGPSAAPSPLAASPAAGPLAARASDYGRRNVDAAVRPAAVPHRVAAARHRATTATSESKAASRVDRAIDALFGQTVARAGAKLRARRLPRLATGLHPTDSLTPNNSRFLPATARPSPESPPDPAA